MTGDDTGVEIMRLQPGHLHTPELEAVVSLHCEAFPAGVLAQLGRDFVRRYYLSIADSPAAYLFGARRCHRLVGFLAGTTDREAFERSVRLSAGGRAVLWRLLTLRLSPLAVLRAVQKRRLTASHRDPAELIAVAVSTTERRSGIGRRLLAHWAETVRRHSLESFLIFTDNREGHDFYLKMGAELLFRFQVGRRTSAGFRMRVSSLPRDAFSPPAVSDRGS